MALATTEHTDPWEILVEDELDREISRLLATADVDRELDAYIDDQVAIDGAIIAGLHRVAVIDLDHIVADLSY